MAVAGARHGQARGERQYRSILRAIEDLLQTERIETLSIGRIAKEAGLTRSGFYFYFDTKYSALAVCLASAWGDLDEVMDAYLAGPDQQSIEEHVRRGIAGTMRVWQQHAALFVAFHDARSQDPQLRDMWNDWVSATGRALASYVEQEREAGRAIPGADAGALVEVLQGMQQHCMYKLSVDQAAPAAVERAIDAMTAVVLASIWGVHALDKAPLIGVRER